MGAIPIIDLFAGPGGLGEGFSSLSRDDGTPTFRIKLSIEKDEGAHRTLELRAFFRQFPRRSAPDDYYDYLANRISRDELFNRHAREAERAAKEAWLAELGGTATPDKEIDARIKAALGDSKNWLLIGGPPCQAYSLVGRSRVIGREGLEHYEADPKHRLYRHYLRILAVHKPPVFVMENVKGLLSAKLQKERIFGKILSDLRHPGMNPNLEYRLIPLSEGRGNLLGEFEPTDFVVRAEDYGIPQARHRIIILGIRSDLTSQPGSLRRSDPANIEDVIGDLPKLRSALSKEPDSAETWRDSVLGITNAGWLHNGAIEEELKDALFQACKRVGTRLTRGAPFLPTSAVPLRHPKWFSDSRLGGVCNHETRGHIRLDLHRYLFAAVFARKYGRSPLLEDFPKKLLPLHENVDEALKETKFNDRFRVQLAGRPSTTVVSHISKDGHYFIHYDSTQCRSLTVREAARLQTFPDNYFFEGPRTEQYRQVGNAVPPLLARKIAAIVAKLFA